ncbi:thioredoxin domain-containing protein [Robiginitomaculum antarcticum]|uniref:thioredoxin domain-containing protein n=1 Tax=Robiginitomaculum antarcticum TaxID=437507 RepID=UPI000375F6D8|nr:thioredoxin domain-containing protein [Robiginitomaculum antarcticum]
MIMKHIILAGLLSAASLGLAVTAAAQSSSLMTPMPVDDGGVRTELAEDHAIGSVSAPITIIVYASVTCPHCAKWFQEEYPVIKRDYIETGKVRMVFRPYPTAPAPLSYAGFAIAQCSGARYMDSVEYQMNNQQEIIGGLMGAKSAEEQLDGFSAYAAQSGLTKSDVQACLAREESITPILKSQQLAQAAKIGGVPAVLMGNKTFLLDDTSAAALSTQFDAVLPN